MSTNYSHTSTYLKLSE